MKNKWKKVMGATLAAVFVMGTLAGCGTAGGSAEGTDSSSTAEAEGNAEGGTIMWLSQMTSGPQYEAIAAYGEAVCAELGYDFTIVYGDPNNDPAENLTAVRNGMTSNVVGIVSSQDGGIQNILEEYPDLYICGSFTDMASVFDEGGSSAGAYENDHFLGTICDGYVDGTNMGHDYAQEVINNGYTKVATMIFPEFAYPQLAVADQAFRQEIEAYNETASEPIEIVGEANVLMFTPLEDSYFLDENHQDLDAIVAFCSDSFVYSPLKTAIANGNCSEDTQLLSSGWEDDQNYQDDIGNTIAYLSNSPIEDIGYAIVMIDNAVNGLSYADAPSEPQRLDSARVNIRNQEDVALINDSLYGTADASKAWITTEELANCTLNVNPDATYADLTGLMASEQLTVEAHK